ncbi:uncharacterized protein V1518DRAFT_429337 [Limtongia smithiae]|uniref:uncharacterized protein n=1 Tax=Limtongia smithiae TaxID=1125753 RepID=UPI0034CDAA07
MSLTEFNDTVVTINTWFTTPSCTEKDDDEMNCHIYFEGSYVQQNFYFYSASLVKGVKSTCLDEYPDILILEIDNFL